MKISSTLSIVAIACALAACGGGGGGGGSDSGNSNAGAGNGGGTTPKPETPTETYPSDAQPGNYADVNRAKIFDIINKNRVTCGFGALKQNSLLDTASAGHANYLQLNETISHTQVNTNTGFTGADLLARATAAGYQASTIGEIVSNENSGSLFAGTSPSGIETSPNLPSGEARIKGLFSSVYHLSAAASEWVEMGVGFSVSGNKTPIAGETAYYGVAVVNFGVPAGTSTPVYTGGKVRSFPCNGTTGVSPLFGPESPSPYPSRDFNASPMGTPVYFKAAYGGSIEIKTAEMVQVSSSAPVATRILNSTDDVNKLLAIGEAFVIPDKPLLANTQYRITVSGTSDGKPLNEVFVFSTGTQN